MAGLRAGALYGRPDLLAKVAEYGRGGNLPVTATACAAASMKNIKTMMPERVAINKRNGIWLSSTWKSWACLTFPRAPTSS